MNINDFNELQRLHGESVVWHDTKYDGTEEWIFAIGDGVDCADEFYEQVEIECENNGSVEFVVAYGDDTVNAIVVNDFSQVSENIEEFIKLYVGRNCYTDE